MGFSCIDFRLLSPEEPSDSSYFFGSAWSRVYEYPLVHSVIKQKLKDSGKIHNTSWGWEGTHVKFKEELDQNEHVVIHSDVKPSSRKNTFLYDITQSPPEQWVNSFDAVLNISTVEEVRFDHVTILKNLLAMVKPEGYLIITFDLPGLQVPKVSQWVGKELSVPNVSLNGANSSNPNHTYTHLNCGLLVLQKN